MSPSTTRNFESWLDQSIDPTTNSLETDMSDDPHRPYPPGKAWDEAWMWRKRALRWQRRCEEARERRDQLHAKLKDVDHAVAIAVRQERMSADRRAERSLIADILRYRAIGTGAWDSPWKGVSDTEDLLAVLKQLVHTLENKED